MIKQLKTPMIITRKIRMGLSKTINTGNFESIKIHAEEEIEVKATRELTPDELKQFRGKLWQAVKNDLDCQEKSLGL